MEDTMKRKRFTEEQIIGVLKEADAGLPIKELVRKYGVTEQTYYRWKSKFGGMEVNEAKRLRALEDENRLRAGKTTSGGHATHSPMFGGGRGAANP
jgi:putative transposase